MTLRAFRTTFLVAIEETELEDRDTPVTLDELKKYLNDALIVSFNDEEHGNPVGLSSMEVFIEQLTEISPQERKALYGI